MDIHPITVHFTIGLLVAALLFEAVGWLTGRETFKHAGWWNMTLAGIAATISVLAGRAAAAMFSGARLGGRMVYEHGVGVRPVMEMLSGDHDHDHEHGH